MAKTVSDVMKMMTDKAVQFVDLRFTDTRGKEQHVTVPVSALMKASSARGTRSTARRLPDGKASKPRT